MNDRACVLISLVMLSLFCGKSHAGTSDNVSCWIPLNTDMRIEFSIFSGERASLNIKQGAVKIAYDNGTSQDLSFVEEGLNGEMNVQLDDFNFDGKLDIAVSRSYGYGGVNVFSDIFLFDEHRHEFTRGLTDVSDIVADENRRELRTGQKSGPQYVIKIYRFSNGRPYIFRESVNLGSVGSGLAKITLKDPDGAIVQTVIAESDEHYDAPIPAVRAIAVERAYLYNQPVEAAKTSMYVIKGDRVTLLDAAGAWDEWVLMRYQGTRLIEKWIKFDQLELD
ncbi:MAG: hypothetical protein GY801_53045 [bacterium]|nr:hypothetical protein [bacterium]